MDCILSLFLHMWYVCLRIKRKCIISNLWKITKQIEIVQMRKYGFHRSVMFVFCFVFLCENVAARVWTCVQLLFFSLRFDQFIQFPESPTAYFSMCTQTHMSEAFQIVIVARFKLDLGYWVKKATFSCFAGLDEFIGEWWPYMCDDKRIISCIICFCGTHKLFSYLFGPKCFYEAVFIISLYWSFANRF